MRGTKLLFDLLKEKPTGNKITTTSHDFRGMHVQSCTKKCRKQATLTGEILVNNSYDGSESGSKTV
jgi:hypothetical protein